MKNIIGNIHFGGNALNFSFSDGKMDIDVLTGRAFSDEEVKTVESVIEDLTSICAKLDKNIKIGEDPKMKSFAWIRKFIPAKKSFIRKKITPWVPPTSNSVQEQKEFPIPTVPTGFILSLMV